MRLQRSGGPLIVTPTASSSIPQEYLGAFGLGPFDTPGGRTMGDTTTLWAVELYE